MTDRITMHEIKTYELGKSLIKCHKSRSRKLLVAAGKLILKWQAAKKGKKKVHAAVVAAKIAHHFGTS